METSKLRNCQKKKKTFSSFCGFSGSVNSAQQILKSVWLSANKSTAKRTRKKIAYRVSSIWILSLSAHVYQPQDVEAAEEEEDKANKQNKRKSNQTSI